jgi:hypothetical protein
MRLQQRECRGRQQLPSRRTVRLRRSEHHPDAVGVRRPATKADGAGIEINVLPRQPERLADAPSLHEAQRNSRCESLVAHSEKLRHLSRAERSPLHLRDTGRPDLLRDIVVGETETHRYPTQRRWAQL